MLCLDIFSGMLRKRDLTSSEYKNPIPIAIFVGIDLKVEHLEFENPLALTPNSHLQDSCSTAIALVLRCNL